MRLLFQMQEQLKRYMSKTETRLRREIHSLSLKREMKPNLIRQRAHILNTRPNIRKSLLVRNIYILKKNLQLKAQGLSTKKPLRY